MNSDLPPGYQVGERKRTPYHSTTADRPSFERPEQPEQPEQPERESPAPDRRASQQENEQKGQKKRKSDHYGPRTCRICLETEHPKFSSNVTSAFASTKPTYESEDPELGRLLSPCKCKGSAKYVHEGCLSAWRLTNPGATRNFWQCPTCKFNYRLSRLRWASILSSRWSQLALTLVALIVSLFILGFIADPILDMWFDPVGSIADTVSSVVSDPDAVHIPPSYEEPSTWLEHFTKGFFSLGLIGAIKSFVAMGPWHWMNFRSGGLFGSGRRRGSGRGRMDNFNIMFVLIGAFTFFMAVWKFVKGMSARVLANMSNKVMDVDEDE